jgi:6,7-dimethyl-8-ribityllumazine synthase
MAGKASNDEESVAAKGVDGSRVLLIEARFYPDISDTLANSAIAVLQAADVEFDRVAVPGALEIPQALALAIEEDDDYDGAVVIGCVIRGETSHYDVVVNNANHFLMKVAIENAFPVGNAILTVDNEAQARARAEAGKGADAAKACLRLIALQDKFRTGD